MTSYRPLADRARPRQLDEVVGQDHLLAADKPLRRLLDAGSLHSMVLWGPPGCGKTTLAHLIGALFDASVIALSAVLSGVKDIRAAVVEAKANQESERATILFVDEVHRFNKTQQDAFLPHVESGLLVLIGATTENPSFALNNALLSRAKVYVLKALTPVAILAGLKRALEYEAFGISQKVSEYHQDDLALLAQAADGDMRRALNMLETAIDILEEGVLTREVCEQVIGQGFRRFDDHGDAFYDQISALHKCVRNSHPDAGLYWMTRMLDGGCDPRYLARRLLRIASEDIGNADPRAMSVALDAWQAFERMGSPEGELALAQAVTYLACAPKSNAVYLAAGKAASLIKDTGSLPVPMHLRNAPTKLMGELGYGNDYKYDHDSADGFAADQTGFPEELQEPVLYEPVPRGLEIKIGEKLKNLRQLRQKVRKPS